MGRGKGWGTVQKLKSGKYRARFPYKGKKLSAPMTFSRKAEADSFLARTRVEIEQGTFIPYEEREALAAQQEAEKQAQLAAEARKMIPFGEYATKWIETRTNNRGELLKPTTSAEYKRYLKTGKLQSWEQIPLPQITTEMVREWYYTEIQDGHKTSLAKQYDFMKSVLKTAVDDDLIPKNPCTVPGGSNASTGKETEPPTDAELDLILKELPTKYEVIAVIAAAGGLRKGEILALTAQDVEVRKDEDGKVECVDIFVTKSVAETKDGKRVVGTPKTQAGVRHIAIYGKDAVTIADFIKDKSGTDLLWTNRYGTGHMPATTFQDPWEKAREVAGRPDLTFHALRYYHGTRFAQSGATMKETMDRLGHNDIKAAMRYQHAGSRAEELARKAARN